MTRRPFKRLPTIGIMPDWLTHYRSPVFKNIAIDLPEYSFSFFADPDEQKAMQKLGVDELKGFGLPVHPVRNHIIAGHIFWQSGILNRLIANQLDCIICWGCYHYLHLYPLILAARKTHTKIIFWTHGAYGRESSLKRLMQQVLYTHSDHVLLYGEKAKHILVQSGIPERKLTTIYNSLDYDRQILFRKNLSKEDILATRRQFLESQEDAHLLFFVGRLTYSKKLDQILYALKALQHQNFHFLFVGDGEARSSLKNCATHLGLASKVTFYGACHQEETLSRLISSADLCISPGNVGLTAMHSLVYGTPVITHGDFSYQGPEVEAITEGVNGLFFQPNNVDDLRRKIDHWLSSRRSREIIREACYIPIDTKFNYHNQAKILSSVLANLFD